MFEQIHNFIIDNILLVAIGITFLFFVIRLFLKDRTIALLSREASSFKEILEFSPEPFFVWLYDKKKRPHPLASRKLSIILELEKGRNTDFAEVLEKIENPQALADAFENLKNTNERFVTDIKLKDKDRYFLCDGNKIVTFAGEELALIIWFKDISDKFVSLQKNKEVLENLEQEKNYYEKIINALPFPMWVRNDGQLISDCNTNYIKAVEANDKTEVKQNHIELAQGDDVKEIRSLAIMAGRENKQQRKIFPIIINSELKNVEINETIIDNESTIGWAREMTFSEFDYENMAKKHNIFDKIIESAPVGIVVMDDKLNIKYFNKDFLKIWQIGEDVMNSLTTLSDLLGQLNKQRKLPEYHDFSAYKEDRLKFYTDIKELYTDNINIHDTMALKRFIVPLEDGGTITYLIDISSQQNVMRDYYTLSENYKMTLENINNAVAIFGADGRLKITNNAFVKMWRVEKSHIENLLLSEILDLKRQFFDKKYNWVDVKAEMLSHISSGSNQVIAMERNDNKNIDCTSVRLIDGSIMLYYEIKN